jgi:ribosomal protein S18 acetylase RimI-like enzyme
LVRTAETLAREHRRALLVLDTASDEGASAFYEKLGYTRAGEIPDYALKPHGGLTGTIIFWKKV